MTGQQDIYDVIVVGAGPAGATTAYYLMQGRGALARGGGAGEAPRVALLEKAHFPRDKVCGDAWCAPALDILEDMGVLQKLEAEGLVRDTRAGGFVSPSGECFVSTGAEAGAPGTRVYAIKRIICDERIAHAARDGGAELIEGAAVRDAALEDDGLWTLRCGDGRVFRGKMLVAADGAPSKLARKLGVVTASPTGFAARQYVKGGTHNFRADGVLFYPSYILPGYVALFRHYNDDIDLGSYVIPGGAARGKDLQRIYQERVRHDPLIRRVLGPRAEYLEPLRIAPLRLGGVEKSYARQFMAVGDAAGQTDPLTGEGIHTAMIAGRIAARTLHELLARGDLSERACAAYHEGWSPIGCPPCSTPPASSPSAAATPS
jgi:geranylgeranyl reductase family protein